MGAEGNLDCPKPVKIMVRTKRLEIKNAFFILFRLIRSKRDVVTQFIRII